MMDLLLSKMTLKVYLSENLNKTNTILIIDNRHLTVLPTSIDIIIAHTIYVSIIQIDNVA